MVAQMRPLAQMLADDVGDMAGFVLLVGGGIVVDLFAVAVLRPKGLALAPVVVFDDAVGSVQYVGGGTVILFQTNGLGTGEHLLKVQDIFNRSTAEFVDGLVVIAHHADVVGAARQQAHQVELRNAGILIFVHNDIAEFLLVVFPRLGVLLQKPHGVKNQIVKVHRPGSLQASRVGRVNFGNQRRLGVGGLLLGDILRREELILKGADLRGGRLDRQEFVVNHQILVDQLHHALLVVAVIDGKAFGKADALGIAAQHPHARRVEGRGKHIAAHGVPQHGAQTLL